MYGRLAAGTLKSKKRAGRTVVRLPSLPPRPANAEGTIGVKAVAARLGMFEESIRRMVARGELAAVRRGREHRFRSEDVDAYIEGRRIKPGELGSLPPGWLRQPGRRARAEG